MGTKICENCGKNFTPSKRQPYQKFCSHQCYLLFHRRSHQIWLKQNPEKTAGYHRKYYAKNKDLVNTRTRQWSSEKRAYLRRILGNACAICGRDLTNAKYGSFAIHEITGKRHPAHTGFMLKHKENLRLVCFRGFRGCHSFCHFLLDLGYSFEDAQRIYKLLEKKGLPTTEEEEGINGHFQA